MVLRRAVQETVNDTKLDTWAGAMLVLVGPVLMSGVLWLLLDYALPDSAGWARMGGSSPAAFDDAGRTCNETLRLFRQPAWMVRRQSG